MNPDDYMPFFWPKFWEAVKSWPYSAIVAYQKALTHYWFHLKCKGLPDDSEKLRKICETDKDDWDEVCGLVFDNDEFFRQDSSGLWRQKKADKEWAVCLEKIKFNKARAAAGGRANKANWEARRKLEA